MSDRNARRLSAKIERRSLSGNWQPWEHKTFPKGSVGSSWCAEIGEAYTNYLYAALVRHLEGGRIHLAIRTPSNLEPPWRDMQRIKNELFGEDRFAIQIYPAQSHLIDDADMYHLWIMEEGYHPGFGLHDLDNP